MNERKRMKGGEINFLDPYDTKLCKQFFCFFWDWHTCILFFFFCLLQQNYFDCSLSLNSWIIFSKVEGTVGRYQHMLYITFSPKKACCNKDSGKNVKSMPIGNSTLHPRSLLPWNSLLGMAAPDQRRCSNRSTWNNLTQQGINFLWPLSHLTDSRNNGASPFERAKGVLKAVRLTTCRLDWQPGRSTSSVRYHRSAQCILYNCH